MSTVSKVAAQVEMSIGEICSSCPSIRELKRMIQKLQVQSAHRAHAIRRLYRSGTIDEQFKLRRMLRQKGFKAKSKKDEMMWKRIGVACAAPARTRGRRSCQDTCSCKPVVYPPIPFLRSERRICCSRASHRHPRRAPWKPL